MNAGGDPKTIDEVIDWLEAYIEDCEARGDRMGYFAALYRRITRAIRSAIEEGQFADADRMRRFDVTFATRYVTMVRHVRLGAEVPPPWRIADAATRSWWPLVAQHLFLAVNAHVNLDLGIAAAAVAPGDSIHGLRDDFYKLNSVLEEQVDQVRKELVQVWPLMRFSDLLAPEEDDLVDLVVVQMRDHAWRLAVDLAGAQEPRDRERILGAADEDAVRIARMIRTPWLPVRLALGVARLLEIGGVRRKIRILDR